ncbi:neuropeptide-like 1 isoform X3 [Venturia canescens]|uniref:neuropeptide-like 1 isoform X3 n=1 Tax=Venturia canescens TaxID=32260 RepID=UPI001C9CB555|nr:neuropeptide-like 1 isoform X3 [Venturia canescens]
MALSRRHLLSLLWAFVVHEYCLHTVSCQEDDSSRCLPRKTFFALLRLPEVGSNLAAYSRTARIIQDAKDRTDYVNLKSHMSNEDGEDAKICLPPGVYLDLFNDPETRGHLSAGGRAQKMFDDPMDRAADIVDPGAEDIVDSEKRSIATLAKNGDLPISIQDRSQTDAANSDASGQRARFDSLSSESLDGLMKILADSGIEDRHNLPEIAAEYTLPNGELNLEALARDFPPAGKRNVASLARDFALPVQSSSSSGKRNIAALARDYGLPSGKRNVGTLARDWMLPQNASANYRLRYGKRFVGALARSSDFPLRDNEKRNMAALARNGDHWGKRNVGTLARDWSLPNQNRHGRSLTERELNAERFDRELQKLGLETHRDHQDQAQSETERITKLSAIMDSSKKPLQTSAFEAELTNAKNHMIKNVMGGKRSKRQIDYSDEYPLPVMQNTNVFDYEDMIEALTGEYPNTQKRFMGTGDDTELQNSGEATSGYIDMYQPSKRHIGALARHGWLPSFKAARFSRSPRYLVGREDPADGTASDDSTNSSAGTLNHYRRPMTRYLQSLQRDCRHGFRTNPPMPEIEHGLGPKLHFRVSDLL